MGHEASTTSIEDDICAEYIKSLINDKSLEASPILIYMNETLC